MRRVYVASSWRNPAQPSVVRALRDAGHEVYDFRDPATQGPETSVSCGFSWREIAPNWESWTTSQYVAALQHERAVKGFDADKRAMEWADAFVLVMPCGRSAHLEAGWATGSGIPTAVLLEQAEPELMYKLVEGVRGELCTSVAQVVSWLERLGVPGSKPVLFVGEDNPYGDDPRYALYDEPEGASGHRLRTILGLSRETYLGPGVRRANLCDGGFSTPAARLRASEILVEAREEYRAVVMLGAKVGRAFGLGLAPFESRDLGNVKFVSLPHPSGRNRVWNDPRTWARAVALVRSAGLPTGEASS